MSLLEALLEDELLNPPVVQMEIWIALRTDGVPGSGTRADPYNGSTAALLDGVLSDSTRVPDKAFIHFGPGIFETTGGFGAFAPGDPTPTPYVVGWEPRSGWRLVGSGIWATTLKLVRASSVPNVNYCVVGKRSGDPHLQGFSISEVTIDCNLGGLPATPGDAFARVSSSAIRLPGRDIQVRNVRVINFGTRTTEQECFPVMVTFGTTGSDSENMINDVVEDCILEQPFKENLRESGQMVLSGGETADRVMHYHKGCVIRNCLSNYEYANPDPVPPVPAEGINSDGNAVTLQTRWIHRLTSQDRIQVRGCATAAFNGVFAVASVDATNPRALAYNAPGPAGAVAGTITVQKVVKLPLVVKSLAYDTGTILRLDTYERHYRQADDPAHGIVGDWIRLSGVKVDDNMNGSFKVTAVSEDDATGIYYLKFESARAGSGTIHGDPVIWLDRWPSHQVPIKNLIWDNPTLTIETSLPHYKWPGAYFKTDKIAATEGSKVDFNAYNKCLRWVSATRLECDVATSSDDPNLAFNCVWDSIFAAMVGDVMVEGIGGPTNSDDSALFGTLHTALVGASGIGALVEGNRIYGCEAGIYSDTSSTKSLVVRRNYMFDVSQGLRHALGAYSWFNSIACKTQVRSGDYWLLDFEIVTGMAVGEYVALLLAVKQQSITDVMLVHAIYKTGLPSGIAERLELAFRSTGLKPQPTSPPPPPDPPLSGQEGFYNLVIARWYVCELLIAEENFIDTAIRSSFIDSSAPPAGIELSMGPAEILGIAPYSFGDALLRKNIIRHVDGKPDPQPAKNSIGTFVMYGTNLIVESNIVNVEDGVSASDAGWYSMRRWLGGSVKVFNNVKTSGVMLRQYDFDADAAKTSIVAKGFDPNLLDEADLLFWTF